LVSADLANTINWNWTPSSTIQKAEIHPIRNDIQTISGGFHAPGGKNDHVFFLNVSNTVLVAKGEGSL